VGCTASIIETTTRTSPGTIAAIMTPKLDSDGTVIGVDSLRYTVEGLHENGLDQRQLRGPCTFFDGTQVSTTSGDETTAWNQWLSALEGSGDPSIEPILPPVGNGFIRNAIPAGDPGNTEAIGDLIQTFPKTEEHGRVRESIQIYPAP
jgi:hypothetical protein